MLIAFRFLAGLGGSAPQSIGGGVIGDLFDAEHRGQAISIYSLAPLLGPVAGGLGSRRNQRGVGWCVSAPVLPCFPDIDGRSSGRRPLRMPLSRD